MWKVRVSLGGGDAALARPRSSPKLWRLNVELERINPAIILSILGMKVILSVIVVCLAISLKTVPHIIHEGYVGV